MALLDVHPLYAANVDKWILGRDTCAGQDAIKDKVTTYLPDFEPSQGTARYNAYKQRALFYGYTGETKDKLIGAIFRKPAQSTLPKELEYMLEDCTGNGFSLEQFSKEVISDILETGRAGILVDYPEVEEGLSKEAVKKFDIKPTFSNYQAESIYNWKSTWKNGKEYLTQVRLYEIEEVEINEFTVEFKRQYRILDLVDNKYRVRVYNQEEMLISEYYPKANSKQLDHIPFYFVGASNNASTVDKAPLYNLGLLNIGHYINSADYEESLHYFSSPTLFMTSDLSVDQFNTANPKGINIGVRSGHFLGPNGSATLLQMEANTAAREAMEDKQEQMKAFGAEFFDSKGGNQTAEEARIKATSQSNTLNTITGNTSEGIEAALEDAALFLGIKNIESIEYDLNTEFFPITLTTAEIGSMITLKEKGIIAQKDIRDKLRITEFISPERTDEELDREAEILKEVLPSDNNSI